MIQTPFVAQSYDEFAVSLRDSCCALCRLSSGRTRIVVDRGNPRAKLVFVGEAPGETEDAQGMAFVGRAGKLLDRMMNEIGLDTNKDALIINVVKCRPPENRAPKPDEAASCMPYLRKQIELVSPRFIVLLGTTALKHLAPERGKVSMAGEVGKVFYLKDFPRIPAMLLFHPAYLLYDPRKRPVMRLHLETLKNRLASEAILPADLGGVENGAIPC